MDDQKKSTGEETAMTGKTNGPQGVDKAPGEEVSGDNVQFNQETQKGKKVAADPEKESDQPTHQPGLQDQD